MAISLSMFRCAFSISLGTRLSHWFKETSMNSSAANSSSTKVGITRVFDIVRCVGGNISNIVGAEVHCAGIIDRKEYGHAALAGNIVLPLGGVRVPVQLTHVSGLDDEQGRGNMLGGRKVVRVDDANFACSVGYRWLHRPHAEGVLIL